jgi:hypothetical protein
VGHVSEVSAQCLIGKCGACPDPDCECECHPVIRLHRASENAQSVDHDE